MNKRGPRYSKEEAARRGTEWYRTVVKPVVGTPANKGRVVVIDIETGEYELDDDLLVAAERLYARLPDAQPWAERVGYRVVTWFGGADPEERE